MDIDVYEEISIMLKRAYDKGYKAGVKDAREKHNKAYERHCCKDCVWLCGDRSSVGIRCMNEYRTRTRVTKTSAYKQPSATACKSGFQPREREP